MSDSRETSHFGTTSLIMKAYIGSNLRVTIGTKGGSLRCALSPCARGLYQTALSQGEDPRPSGRGGMQFAVHMGYEVQFLGCQGS
jgi:hypothetical protein